MREFGIAFTRNLKRVLGDLREKTEREFMYNSCIKVCGMKQGITPQCEVGSATNPEGGKNFEEHVKSREISYLKGSKRRKPRMYWLVKDSGGVFWFCLLVIIKSSILKENIIYPSYLCDIFPII